MDATLARTVPQLPDRAAGGLNGMTTMTRHETGNRQRRIRLTVTLLALAALGVYVSFILIQAFR